MRTTDVKPTSFVSELCCDRCGTKVKHDEADGFNNFLQIEFDASWGSAIVSVKFAPFLCSYGGLPRMQASRTTGARDGEAQANGVGLLASALRRLGGQRPDAG